MADVAIGEWYQIQGDIGTCFVRQVYPEKHVYDILEVSDERELHDGEFGDTPFQAILYRVDYESYSPTQKKPVREFYGLFPHEWTAKSYEERCQMLSSYYSSDGDKRSWHASLKAAMEAYDVPFTALWNREDYR